MCPICHSKLLEIRNEDDNYPVVCAVCGVKGTLNVVDGKVKFEVKEEDKVHSHVMLSGKFEHADELNNVSLKPAPNAHELPERLMVIDNDNRITEEKIKNITGRSTVPSNVCRGLTLKETVEMVEKEMIENALKIHGSTHKAAKALGITQPTVFRKAKALNIKLSR